jgi:hypothetical protein
MLFVGPSYQLNTRKAAHQRTVNMHLLGLETPDKAPFILESVPGLVTFATIAGVCRGGLETTDGRCFVVYGSTLYEVASDGTATSRGALATSSGEVSMAYGLTQLVMVDGANGYVLTLATNVFQAITSTAFYGSATVKFLSNYFLFVRPDTQQVYISDINDATTFDALDFASEEQMPDNVVGQEVLNSQWWLFGRESTAIWFTNGNADFPFGPTGQGVLEVGCVAPHSVKKIGGTVMWVGRSREGYGIVYRSQVYDALRVSTQAVEQVLQASTGLESAVSWTYQKDGLSFWCLNAPGVESTWCYELTTGTWHERCELDAQGLYEPMRVTHHVFAHNKHLCGAADGKLYELSDTAYTFAGDAMVRERIGPHASTPDLAVLRFEEFVLDCTTGGRGQRTALPYPDPVDDDLTVELSWADYRPNRALQFSNAVLRSIGYVGETIARLIWRAHVLGSGRDRLWRVKFSGNAPFAIVGAEAKASKGSD